MGASKGIIVELTAPKGYTRDGSQLELFRPAGLEERPWSGKSPRVLTKAFGKFSLGALPRGGLS